MPVGHGLRDRRVHRGPIVAAQLALLPALITGAHPAATTLSAAVLAGLVVRVRRRWLYQWAVTAARFAVRPRTAGPGADPAGVFALAHPGSWLVPATVGRQPAGLVAGGYGVTALLDLEPAGVGPAAPLPVRPEQVAAPGTGPRLLIATAPAGAGAHPAADDYRELAAGPTVLTRRVLVAVPVSGTAAVPDLAEGDLAATVAAVRRRLAPAPARLLDLPATAAALADLGCQAPTHEHWSHLRNGQLRQVSYRVPTVPPRLPHPPAAYTVTAFDGAAMTVRIADTATIADDASALLPPPGRLDGAQLRGLADTLPPPPAPAPVVAATGAPAVAATADPVTVAPAGLVVGRDRAGGPVLVPIFQPAPTRVVLLGRIAVALLLAWRSLGSGARVLVQTARPPAWEPLARAATAAARLRIGGGPDPVPGALHLPRMQLVDADAPRALAEPCPWTALVHCLPALDSAGRDAVAHADLVLAEPLPEREATLVSATLGLGAAGAQLCRDAPDTPVGPLAVISGGAVRWTDLSLTAREHTLTAAGTALDRRTWQDP